MLAQNFLTPTKLDIPEDLHEALIAVLGQLERGEIQHLPIPEEEQDKWGFSRQAPNKWGFSRQAPTGFNMQWWGSKTFPGCGTPACIGGWCEYQIGHKFTFIYNYSLHCLFYPNNEHPPEPYDYEAITPEQAARALRSYLTRGAPNWAEALQDD